MKVGNIGSGIDVLAVEKKNSGRTMDKHAEKFQIGDEMFFVIDRKSIAECFKEQLDKIKEHSVGYAAAKGGQGDETVTI